MAVETFVTNQFIAGCTPEIDEEYVVSSEGLLEGCHVKYDKDQDHIFRDNDYDGAEFTSNHIGDGSKLYYVGRGWGIAHHPGGVTWPNPTLSEAEMKAAGFDLFYLFSNQPGEPVSHTGGVKVYGGEVIEKIIKNQS
jgi:hypothetical protein